MRGKPDTQIAVMVGVSCRSGCRIHLAKGRRREAGDAGDVDKTKKKRERKRKRMRMRMRREEEGEGQLASAVLVSSAESWN